MITHRTLRHGIKNPATSALRFSIYYANNTKSAQNLTLLKKKFSEAYGREVSYSVMISCLIDFFLKHSKEIPLINPERMA